MPNKPKVALYWCASCGGCEEAVVDLAEDILLVVDAVDIVFWPVAMDVKTRDVEAMPDGSIDVALINGAIRSSEQEEMARLLRRKSGLVIAFGSCAQLGGIPSLANLFDRERILKYVYEEAPSVTNQEGIRPATRHAENGEQLCLAGLRELVRPLDRVVEVNYYVPGCPPTPRLFKDAVFAILSRNLPPKGTVLAPDIALCDQCSRKDTKPLDLSFTEFKRPHQTPIDPERCFLAQGILCMGPATRGGCEALCERGNMPCTGCFGPTSRAKDQGAKILSCVCSSVTGKTEEEIDHILSGIPDPVGTFYRYGLGASLLRARRPEPVGA